MHIGIALLILLAILAYLLLKKPSKPNDSRSQPASRYEALVTDAEFEDMVLETSKRTPVLVDFFAEWCGPCKAFTPLLAQLAADYRGAFLLAKIDVDKNPQTAAAYNIRAMPTVMLFKDGECVESFTGGKLPHSLKFILTKNGIHSPDQSS